MKHANKTRSGIAMILVVVMMAAAAIMSFALLSSASIQAEATRNSVSSVSADGLAQSGTNLAMYYLMYPDKVSTSLMTTTNGVTYYNPGTNVPTMNLSDGSSVSKINVALSSHSGTLSTFGVDVTANSGSTSASLTRTLHSVLQVQEMYTPKFAMATNGAFTIPSSGCSVSINGNVRSDGGLGGLLSAVLGPIIVPNNTALPTYPATAVPTYSQLNLLKLTLPAYPGGTAQSIGSIVTNTSGFPSVNGSNPDSVFFSTGSLTLGGTVNLTGTVVVPAGCNLYINSASITISTAKTGQPALIVGGDVVFKGGLVSTRSLTVNGVCWVGGKMTASGGILPTSQFTVNGALMWGGTNSGIDTTSILGSSYLHVNWPTTGGQLRDPPNWDYLYVPNLADEGQIPRNVKVLSSSIK